MVRNEEWQAPNGVKTIMPVGAIRPTQPSAIYIAHALSDPANYTISNGRVVFHSAIAMQHYNETHAAYHALCPNWDDQYDAALTLLAQSRTDWVPYTIPQIATTVNFKCLQTRFLSLPSAQIVQAFGNLTLPAVTAPTLMGREYWVYFFIG